MRDRERHFERPPPNANHLLATLPEEDLERLRQHMRYTPLALGCVLFESGAPMRDVYFPVSGLVSLIYCLEDGGTAEIAVVGNDGCVGVAILLGGETTPSRAIVQIAGSAYRIAAPVLLAGFRRGGPTARVLLRYIQSLMTQMAQTAVCNRHHTVEQQLCRWLLLSLDRVPSNRIDMTQQLISNMLGVRRAGITQAASKLQAAGLIEYRRGHITVPDRVKLEAHACECYAVVKRETDRLQPSTRDADPQIYPAAPFQSA
jgi:CRP-like cAMP-binding protein